MEVAEQTSEKPGWRYYLQREILVLFFLGFSAGLPLPLVIMTLTAWLGSVDIQKSTIGLFAWVGFAYALKFLWAPLVDSLPIPLLTRWLGQRRSWLLLGQFGVIVGLIAISNIDPTVSIGFFAMVAVITAVFSATQDIALDAYRIEIADMEMQGVLAGAYQYGYRLAVIVAMAGALYIADFVSWSVSYKVMAACMSVGVITTLLCKEPIVERIKAAAPDLPVTARVKQWFADWVAGPIADLLRRYGMIAFLLIALILFYRVSDYVLGIIANPFYLDAGYSLSQIATVAKLYGSWVSLAGIAGGAWATKKFGPYRAVIVATMMIAATNLWFAAMALSDEPQVWLFTVTISFDNFAQGFSGTVFIVFLSSLVNLSFTATQYALLSSISALLGKFVSGFSGFVQEAIGWFGFFIYASATGIPAIILSIVAARYFSKQQAADD